MARALWSAVMSFGLVPMPLQLYSTTKPHKPAFHRLEKGTSHRIRYHWVNERTGEPVE